MTDPIDISSIPRWRRALYSILPLLLLAGLKRIGIKDRNLYSPVSRSSHEDDAVFGLLPVDFVKPNHEVFAPGLHLVEVIVVDPDVLALQEFRDRPHLLAVLAGERQCHVVLVPFHHCHALRCRSMTGRGC